MQEKAWAGKTAATAWPNNATPRPSLAHRRKAARRVQVLPHERVIGKEHGGLIFLLQWDAEAKVYREAMYSNGLAGASAA